MQARLQNPAFSGTVTMYELQHNGDISHIKEHAREDILLADQGFSALQAEERPHLSLEDWRRFVAGKDHTGLPPSPVLASWQRCQSRGVDPWMPSCTAFVPMKKISSQVDLLKSLGNSIEHTVYAAIRDRDLLMTVVDAEGRILRTIGNRRILQQADSLRFGPGAVWSEASVGTNAISLALDTHLPWHIRGEEHFCLSHHTWSCSATPIFNPLGGLWGCLDISGHVTSDHSQALWLTMMAAREMERLLLMASVSSMEAASRDLVGMLLGSVPVGVCLVNEQGIITYANPQAAGFLGGKRELRGTSAADYFDLRGIDLAADISSCSLSCRANPCLLAEISPFASPLPGGSPGRHYCITLHEERTGAGIVVPRSMAASRKNHAEVREREDEDDPFGQILYQSSAMRAVVERARVMSRSSAPILLLGETGTGKELFARALHRASARADKPFVAVNCGALPRDLIQSELFGHEKGSFTGAGRSWEGKFEQADGGTLFLDEISEMPLDMQVNLLRPLETGTVTRVGGSQTIHTDFRLITATNRNIEELIASGSFREDLFYRIHVLTLELPPLRDRAGDITLIAKAYGRKLSQKHNLPYEGFTAEALACLESYDWPGNVRQLVHSVEYAVNMSMGSCIGPEHLPKAIRVQKQAQRDQSREQGTQDFSLNNMERRTIVAAIEHYRGNILKAARALGIGRNTLYAKMRKYHIS